MTRRVKPFAALMPSEIEAERTTITPRGYMTATSPEIPFGFQSARDFELLAHALLQAETGDAGWYDLVQLMPEGADQGMDLRLYQAGALTGIVQCKRYRKAIGHDQVLGELAKVALFAFEAGVILPKGCRYQFWTATSPTKSALNLFADTQAWMAENLSDQLWAELIEKVRLKSKSLSTPALSPNDTQSVIKTIKGLTLFHVGPLDLAARLQKRETVRKLFFRSPSDITTSVEITQQRDERRDLSLRRAARQGRAGTAPFVAPVDLDATFREFIASPASVFLILGGSGYGKSTWSMRTLETPPAGFEVDVILGEEIKPDDADFGATFARLLTKTRSALDGGGLAARSVWRWLDGANRLMIVDGLDRAPASVRPNLNNWVQNSVRLCEERAVKLVITTRPETWEPLSARIEEDVETEIFRLDHETPSGRPISYRFSPLSLPEARCVYAAHGLPSDIVGRRPFRSPGQIRMLSRLRAELGATHVTKRDLIAKLVDQARAEVQENNIGRASAETVLTGLGRLLADSPDGRVALNIAQHISGDSLAVIDAFLLTDLIVAIDGHLRAEPDEAAEYLAAQTLDIDDALNQLPHRSTEPLFVGALAMAVASLEETDRRRLSDIVDQLLSPAAAMEAHEVAVRIIAELRDQADFEPVIRSVMRATPNRGYMLLASNIADLIQDLRLPAERRLDLLLELEDGEDADDWRTKFWINPAAQGRFITPFARAATSAVRDAPRSALLSLLARHRNGLGQWHVTCGLMIEAGLTSPDATFSLLWSERNSAIGDVLLVLAQLDPMAAARHAEAVVADIATDGVEDIYAFLYRSVDRVREDAGAEVLEAFGRAADTLLPTAKQPGHIGLLKLIQAFARPLDAKQQEDLIIYWDHIWDNHIWRLIIACPLHLYPLLDRLIDEAGRGGPHSRSLIYLNAVWADLADGQDAVALVENFAVKLATAMATSTGERLNLIASTVELLLYADEQNPQRSQTLRSLADGLSQSPDGEIRKLMLYFAGSPFRDEAPLPGALAYRDRLLHQLVEAEDGDTLSILLWKLTESAHERGHVIERLLSICLRLGAAGVIEELDQRSPLTKLQGRDFVAELRAELQRA